jgi:cytochrome c-type biogenesis protein CcmH
MFIFWGAVGLFAAAAAGLMLIRADRTASHPGTEQPVASIYLRQLAEIDELADRALIGPSERKSAHAEAARRLLAAADRPDQAWSEAAGGRPIILAAAIGAPLLALGLYFLVGAPALRDQPFAQRLAGWRSGDIAALSAPELAAVLRDAVKSRPNDPEGLRFLAMAEAASMDGPAAVRALRRAVALAPDRADLWRQLGEASVQAAGGVVDPAARVAFAETLKRDPTDIAARFYMARARIDDGDRAGGAADLRKLLAALPSGDERRAPIQAAIAEAESAPASGAFSAGQLAAIQGMVAGLAERLKTDPDDPQGWVRLVTAYAVLGDGPQRDAALKTARARYADRPALLEQLAQAARTEPLQ